MTAPEPPEVPAEELAAAERVMREIADAYPSGLIQLYMAEFDRMRAELHAREFAASYQAATIGRLRKDRDKLQVDLARALPVIEAAGALLAFRGDPKLYRDQAWWDREADLLDALARAYRAAREPRTGELPPCPHGNDLASECTDGCRP